MPGMQICGIHADLVKGVKWLHTALEHSIVVESLIDVGVNARLMLQRKRRHVGQMMSELMVGW